MKKIAEWVAYQYKDEAEREGHEKKMFEKGYILKDTYIAAGGGYVSEYKK